MPAQIRPTRLEVTDRFPMLAFTIRTPGDAPLRAEVALATAPDLMRADAKARRTSENFFASRAYGELVVPRGEAVYVVPPEVLARFVGARKLYFGLATAAGGAGKPAIDLMPTDASPYVSLAGLSGRSLRRVRTVPSRVRARAPGPLEWAGDVAQPGTEPVGGAPAPANGAHAASGAAPAPTPQPYDDGFGPLPAATPTPPAAAAPAPATPAAQGMAARAFTIDADDVAAAQQMWAGWSDLYDFRPPAAVMAEMQRRGFQVQTMEQAYGSLSIDRYEVRIDRMPDGWDAERLLRAFRANPDTFIDTRNTEFIPYADEDRARLASGDPAGGVWYLNIFGPDNAAVVLSQNTGTHFRVSTLRTPRAGDHPVTGTREFGVRKDGDVVVIYTRGCDRSTHGAAEFMVFGGARHLWESFQRKTVEWVAGQGGSASAPAPTSVQFNARVAEILRPHPQPAAQSYARGLSDEIPGDPGVGGMSIGPDSVRIGDLIVATQRDDAISGGIRLGSRGEVSHVMLAVNHGEVIHAVGEGVVLTTLDAALAHESTAVVLRVPGLSDADRSAIQTAAAGYVGRQYNYLGVLLSQPKVAIARQVCDRLPGDAQQSCRAFLGRIGTGEPRDGRMFCTQVALQAFEDIGKRITTTPPDWTSPQALANVALKDGHLHYVGHLKSAPNDASIPDFLRDIGRKLGVAESLSVVGVDYAPSDPQAAAAALSAFQKRTDAWRAGVPNTNFMPHSAICHITFDVPGGTSLGTGFYVADDLILTAAHVVHGMTGTGKVHVGRNGRGSAIKTFDINPADWTIHPRYQPDVRDYDLAVIRVSNRAPHGWFSLFEQTRSTDDLVIVCGYAADAGDAYKQHLDGDHIRRLSDNAELMQYNLQTTGGTSGSPVFIVSGYEDDERRQSVIDWAAFGVHVSGFDATLNQACRLTESKIAWVLGRGLASAAGLESIAPPDAGRDARTRAKRIGGLFEQRIVEALDRQLDAATLEALFAKLEAADPLTPLAAGSGLAPPPQARARALDAAPALNGGATIGHGTLDVVRNPRPGDITWELHQFNGYKHPDNVAPGDPQPYRDGEKIRIVRWPIAQTMTGGDLFCDIDIDWQCNGKSLGNVAIAAGTSSDALGGKLHVVGQIGDDAVVDPRTGCAGLKIKLRYLFSRTLQGEKVGTADIHLFGDGTYTTAYDWAQ